MEGVCPAHIHTELCVLNNPDPVRLIYDMFPCCGAARICEGVYCRSGFLLEVQNQQRSTPCCQDTEPKARSYGKSLPGKACAIQNPLRGYTGVAVLLFSKPIMFQGQGQEKSLKNISSARKSGSPWPYFASVTALEKPCLKSSRVYALFPFPFGLLLPWASSLINFSVF